VIIYAVTNLGAFAAVTALAGPSGSTAMSGLSVGSAARPMAAVGLLVCLLSLAGIPPFGGWYAKLVVFKAAIDAQSWIATALVVVAALNTAIGLVYYAGALRYLWTDNRREVATDSAGAAEKTLRLPLGLTVVLGTTVGAVLVSGVLPGIVSDLGGFSFLVR
jgi:NADH-quinone oxidoreductase subunit N